LFFMKRILSFFLAAVMALSLTTLTAQEVCAAEPVIIDISTVDVSDVSDAYSYAADVGSHPTFKHNVLTIKNGANVILTGESTDRLVEVNGTANITLDELHINYDAAFGSAMKINNGANVTLTLKGENTVASVHEFAMAGIHVVSGATLTITGDGSLTAMGSGDGAAGIGTEDSGTPVGTIIINGSVTVIAAGGRTTSMAQAVGIGNGWGAAATIRIGNDKSNTEEGTVTVIANGSSGAIRGTSVIVTGLYDYLIDSTTTKMRVFNNGGNYVHIRPPEPDLTPPTAVLFAGNVGFRQHPTQTGRMLLFPEFDFNFDKNMNSIPGTVTVTSKAEGVTVNYLTNNFLNSAPPRVNVRIPYSDPPALAYNTEYTVSITGYKDMYGNEMIPFSYDFTTEYKPIEEMTLEINEPEIFEALVTDVVSHDGDEKGYTVSSVAWIPNSGAVRGNTEYTAEIKLTRKSDEFEFENTAVINGNPATVTQLGNGEVKVSYTFTTGPTPISPDVVIVSPVTGRIPTATATPNGEGFTVGAVSWEPSDNPFEERAVYTATVTVTAKDGYMLKNPFTVNGQPATVITADTNNATIKFEFPETGPSGIVIIESTTDDSAVINLNNETIILPSNFTAARYSINGGTKWAKKAGILNMLNSGGGTNAFSKMFNKPMTLWLENADGTRIEFPAIAPRPKMTRPAIFYRQDNMWLPGVAEREPVRRTVPMTTVPHSVTAGTKTTVWPGLNAYEFKNPNTENRRANGALPKIGTEQFSNVQWESLGDTVFPIGAHGTNRRLGTVYLRLAPSDTPVTVGTVTYGFVPASKPVVLNPVLSRKAPNYKVNYSTETINVKRGAQYRIRGTDSWHHVPTKDHSQVVDTTIGGLLSHWITDGTEIDFRFHNADPQNGAKPPSAAQELTLFPRAEITADTIPAGTKGKFLVPMLQFRTVPPPSNLKWGKVPTVANAVANTYQVRIRPAVGKNDNPKLAASVPKDVTFEIDNNKFVSFTVGS
jgi:hypothetical protein